MNEKEQVRQHVLQAGADVVHSVARFSERSYVVECVYDGILVRGKVALSNSSEQILTSLRNAISERTNA